FHRVLPGSDYEKILLINTPLFRGDYRAAYTHKAKHLEQRRLMLQWWADFLDANSNGMVRPFEFGQKGTVAPQ
ncbi:hypothetical protein EXT52_22010, partial [Pectobacterium polaris]|nr:hypothetical protein [Pectobacterium polaris]